MLLSSSLELPWALVNARVWTGDGPIGEAVGFGPSGRVAGCGTAAAVLAALPPGAEIVDGRGAFVCPGFVDPHVHVAAAASARLATDVAGVRDVVAAVREAARGRTGWITLVGADLEAGPDRERLDAVSAGAAVRIRDRSGHGWRFNSQALRALGVTLAGSDVVPAGVAVERRADHVATGFVADHVGWVGARLGPITEYGRLSGAVREWSRELARAGVVAVCDATATNGPAQARSLARWREDGALMQEASFLAAPDAAADRRLARGAPRPVGVKFADARDRRLAVALRGSRTVAVHCVDPAETATVLQAAAAVPGRRRAPLRLEHAAFVPDDWIADVRRLGATVVTHPSFVHAHGDRYLADPRLEPHSWLYRLRSWTRAGVPLAFASDLPFGPPDPLLALRAAAVRCTARGARIGSAEALSGEPALRALTTAAAACSGLARFGYGRIRPGGPGAVAVLSHDPRCAEQLSELRLLATVIGGAVVD